MACPFLSAKLPVGHSRVEELFTSAILGVNSKIMNSKKILFKVCEVSNSPLQKKEPMKTFSKSMSL